MTPKLRLRRLETTVFHPGEQVIAAYRQLSPAQRKAFIEGLSLEQAHQLARFTQMEFQSHGLQWRDVNQLNEFELDEYETYLQSLKAELLQPNAEVNVG